MSFKKIAAALYLTGAFATPALAEAPDACTNVVDTDALVNTLLYYTPDDWNHAQLATLGDDVLDQVAEKFDDLRRNYRVMVNETFEDLMNAIKREREINWDGVKVAAPFPIYEVLDELRTAGVTEETIDAAVAPAQEAMTNYMDLMIDTVRDIKAADAEPFCIITPGASSPAKFDR